MVVPWCPPRGVLFSSLDAVGGWEKKLSYRTAWSVPWDSSCTWFVCVRAGCRYRATCWRAVLATACRLWRAIAFLMKPWCAEGEVPTAANLNLYRGRNSCVGWHCDDEPLFGKCGDAKLIVSVSFGSSAVFSWRRQSCTSDEGHLCWLGHGDILVMDGQCQDEFLHRTSSGRDLERINVTFRWIKQHASFCPFLKAGVACCLPTCAQGSSVPNTGNLGVGLFWALGVLLCVLCTWGVLVLLASLLCTGLGLLRCAPCWTRPLGGGRWRHYLCNFLEEHPKVHKTPHRCIYGFSGCYLWELYVLALVRQPSLRGYDACMVYSVKGALRRNCRQTEYKTSFSPSWVFLFSRNLTKNFGS